MNIQQTDGVNFGATIEFRLAEKGKNFSQKRLTKLAKVFEKRTAQRYPQDKFVLYKNGNRIGLCGESNNEYLNGEIGNFNEEGINALFNLTDIQFTDKFKKLFSILCYKQAVCKAYNKLCTQRELKGADTRNLDIAFFETIKKVTQESLNKYKILKNFETII